MASYFKFSRKIEIRHRNFWLLFQFKCPNWNKSHKRRRFLKIRIKPKCRKSLCSKGFRGFWFIENFLRKKREIKPKTLKFMKRRKKKNLENVVFSRLLWRRVWDSNPRGVWAPNGFQDRLVMTASITLRVCYLIVFFLAFRILDRDHFEQVFYRLENGVFWTSFGVLHLASSRGRLKFQDHDLGEPRQLWSFR